MNRRDAITTIGLSSLAGTLLAGCGQESESQNTQTSILGPVLMDGEGIQQALPFRHAGVGIFNLAYSKKVLDLRASKAFRGISQGLC